jgi:hypothetical protein
MFGFNGLVAILKLPADVRTWEHWYITFGGMVIAGLLFGFLIALLATGFQYLLSLFSWRAGRNKWTTHR